MLRFTAPRSRGRVIAWGVLLATAAALGVTRWIKASDHKDSALLAADPAADIADVYTFRSPVNPHNVVLAMTVSGDRKSTRLNSSHSQISYAVFCLKKKKIT